ncbi:MAG: DUF882 domain-containing protein [Hyphomicrobiaceae bacterium]|nr:MAG: DUF882 domain-containing protein [Hyphomicrobiaceae bacterium]
MSTVDASARAARCRPLGRHALRSPASLLVVAAAASIVTAGSASAGRGISESWAIDTLDREAARDGEARTGRRTAVERLAERDEDETRPQRRTVQRHADKARRTQRGTRVASLGREVAPAPKPRPSVAVVGSRGPVPRLPREARRNRTGPVVASLGREFIAPAPALQPSLSGGPINWVASAECLASRLRTVLAEVAANFGSLRVNSTCRSRRHNARVGGARRSYHLTGNAADFRVAGKVKEVYAFLKGNRSVGGLKHYGFGLFHIDTGPRRSW